MQRLIKLGWQALPIIITALFIIPILLGLLGTWLPGFGYFPAIGATQFSVTPWLQLFHYPGFYSALQKTLVTGISAALIALMLSFFILRCCYLTRPFKIIENTLASLLSIPHAAFAIGLGFLLAPSGWLLRVVEQITGLLPRPPNWTTFQDPAGISLIITLILKETPFLLFMALAVLPTLQVSRTLWLANSQGHSQRFAWHYLILPRLYRQIRLPFFAVLAYALTVVDIALIAGPTTPPTLAVMIVQRFNDPDLSQRLVGAAGATLLLALVIAALIAAAGSEKLLHYWRAWRIQSAPRPRFKISVSRPLASLTIAVMGAIYAGAILVTLLWSLTQRWRYPDLLPAQFSLRAWQRISQRLADPFWCTLSLATLASLLALILAILALENEQRLRHLKPKLNISAINWLLYLPLLVPQIAFLFGFQTMLILGGLDRQFTTLLWSHLIFVLPYVFLTLAGPYRDYDQRYSWQGTMLSGSPLLTFWRIKLPLLLRPILYAFATGFAVSIAQYLPTLFVGGGHYSTLTTEAVAMTSGSDRRLMAVMAIWQQALPLLVFVLATSVPMLLFRQRKAMRHS